MDRLELVARLPRPIAFVLGGGGSWGAVQLGMLRAIAQTDLTPDLIVGTSVGSLNGVVLAADPTLAVGRLEQVWPRVTRAEVFPGGWIRGARTLTESKAWIYDNQRLADLITGELPVTTFDELAVPYVAVATDFWSGGLVEMDSGEVRSALLASSAIPGIFPWVDRDERRLVDGALVANVPVTVALSRGAKSLVVLDCGLGGVTAQSSTNFLDVLGQSAAIFARRQLASDLLACANVPVVWLSRGRTNDTSQLDFTATDALIDEGYAHSMRTLSAINAVRALPVGVYGAPPEFRADERLGSLLR